MALYVARPLFNPRTTFQFYDDFLVGTTASGSVGQMGWTVTLTGVGKVLAVGTHGVNEPGIVQVTRGTTATSASTLACGTAELLMGGGAATIELRVRVVTLADGTNSFAARAGLADAGGPKRGLWFEHDHTTGFWKICSGLGGTITTTTTGTTVVANTWFRLKIVTNAACSSVEYFINDVSVGTITTNMPVGAGAEIQPMFSIIGTVGTVARQMDIDYFYMTQTFTTSR